MSYPENVRNMSTRDFIDNLDLEFYISNESQRVDFAKFLFDLASGNARKKFIIFYGEGNNGKSTLINNIDRLFGDNKNWYRNHPVTYNRNVLNNDNSYKYKNQYLSQLLISEFSGDNNDRNDCIKKLLQKEPISWKYRMGTSFDHVSSTCNILIHCNQLPKDKDLLDRALIIEFRYIIQEQVEKIRELSINTLNEFLINDITNIITKEYQTSKL